MLQEHADTIHAKWDNAIFAGLRFVDEDLYDQLMGIEGCTRALACWIVAQRERLLPLLAQSTVLRSNIACTLAQSAAPTIIPDLCANT
jgi:hypothetical protein